MQKRIAFFSGDITRSGGTERVAILIANELCKKEQLEVKFVSLEERRAIPFFEIDDRIHAFKLYNRIERSIIHICGIVKRLRKFVEQNNIDVLIDIDGILDIYSLPIKLFSDVKVVSWEHFNYYQNPFVPYRKISRRMAARWADTIVTLTEEDRGYYEDNLNIRCPIQCIYNPIIWKKESDKYNFKSRTILSVGRLTYQKGFDLLVEIAKNVLHNKEDWKWIVLGEGEDREYLEKKIEEYGLQEKLILKGDVNNVDDYYKEAAFFVMTSRFEGLPMTLLETKPYKLPLICFKCKTGPSELVKDGVNGYLVDEGRLDLMETAVLELMDNEEKRKLFSEKALLDLERFDLDKIVECWMKLIEGV